MVNESKPIPERVSARVSARVAAGLDNYLVSPTDTALALQELFSGIDVDVLEKIEAVLGMKMGLSYRDGLIIQLAWGLEVKDFDHTHKGEGGRSAASSIASALSERHIAAVRDAYQNIGKNTPNLARGNVLAFDDLLRWMNAASTASRERLLNFLLAKIALTARNVLSMPSLARAELTFVKVARLLDDLLAVPSGGAHEQFAVAAFLEALIDEFGLGGVGQLSIKTKNINASDASSGTAADVQIMRGNKIEEAFEVSASDWRGKLSQALDAARNADLARVHIIAYGDDLEGLEGLLKGSTTDAAVMDVRGFLRLIVGLLKKPAREIALRRLYELIERNQPEVERVNAYVTLLGSHALTA